MSNGKLYCSNHRTFQGHWRLYDSTLWIFGRKRSNIIDKQYCRQFILHRKIVKPYDGCLSKFGTGLQCACKGLSPVIGIAFTPAHSHNVTLAIDHTWQAGIAALQVGLRALPPSTEFPNIFRVTTHLEKALVFLGLGADDVFFDIMHKVVTLFVPEFLPITHRPTEAIFATAGRAAAGTVQLAASFFNGPIQLFGALVKSGDTGEMESWMIDKPMSQFHIFTYDVANNVHWLLELQSMPQKGHWESTKINRPTIHFHCFPIQTRLPQNYHAIGSRMKVKVFENHCRTTQDAKYYTLDLPCCIPRTQYTI